MFEMASMPWYMENLDSSIEREAFLKQYLRAKANYHEQRYDYIKKLQQTGDIPPNYHI